MVWPFRKAKANDEDVEYEYETDSQGSVEIEEYVEYEEGEDDEVEYEIGGDREVTYVASDDDDEDDYEDEEQDLVVLTTTNTKPKETETDQPYDSNDPGQDKIAALPIDDLSTLNQEYLYTNQTNHTLRNGKEKEPPEAVPAAVPATELAEPAAEPPAEPPAATELEEPDVANINKETQTDLSSPAKEGEASAELTSLQEKQSLLALAAEHDRVDIIKGILSEQNDREALLHTTGIPPLHVAVAHGSTNATSCLLRMGANPSLLPNIQDLGLDKAWVKYDNVTAWELAFGKNCTTNQFGHNGSSTWFTPVSSSTTTTYKPVDMAPSKREGIRHAFTAEALRCIGADEQHRLEQLLASGMPTDIDIGGKTLHGWCIEMGATNCQALIGGDEQVAPEELVEPTSPTKRSASFQGDDNDVTRLTNRLEEVESLASALSTCLDNLAEEVSVCHGLLLLGGGGTALASHVRSLKELMERRKLDLQTYTERWNRAEDDMEHLMEQCGDDTTALLSRPPLFRDHSARRFPTDPVQLQAQIGASENKVRKLRASIGDMSEENTTAIKEVEKKGLSGGLKLVRGLREELRELEFQLSAAKSGEGACRARIQILQAKVGTMNAKAELNTGDDPLVDLLTDTKNSTIDDDHSDISDPDQPKSIAIANGKSDALMLHQTTGYMPLNIWLILLRIIGLGRVAVKTKVAKLKDAAASNVMIV